MSKRPSPSERHRAEIESWWALIVGPASSVFGMLLITYDAALMVGQPTAIRSLALFAGLAFQGPVVSASFATILRAARGTDERE
jgi:hypothetical protein